MFPVLTSVAIAQFSLPRCAGTMHNCWASKSSASGDRYVGEFFSGQFHGLGAHTLPSGDVYVGEFRLGERNGQGIEYSASGEVRRSGTWLLGRLESAYPIDANRFPLGLSVRPVTGANDQASGDESMRKERDRATAELEAERDRRRQLEEELARERSRNRQQPARTEQTPKQRCLAQVESQDAWCQLTCVAVRTAVCYDQCATKRLMGMAGCTAYD